jgi:GT2 family glycosyltransferase
MAKVAAGNHSGRKNGASTQRPQAAIVIVNWNGHEDTRLCLESLRLAGYRPLRVIVVDNGSTIPGIDEIESEYPEVDVIKAGRNLGFSGGNNIGIIHALEAGAEYIGLLNNDTIVAENFLEPLIEVLEADLTTGAVSGTILQYKDVKTDLIWYAGGRLFEWRAGAILLGYGEKFKPPAKGEVVPTSFLSGCFFVARGSVLRSIGLLDEDFFFGVEDLHLAWTLRKRGIRMCYVPESIIWHRSGRSRRFDADEIYRGYIAKILLVRKQRSILGFGFWLLGFSAYLLGIGWIPYLYRRKDMGITRCSKREVLAAMLKAIGDSWRGRFNTKPGALYQRG